MAKAHKIPGIVIHCSATPEGVPFDIDDIDEWHRERGWRGCGYHYVVGLGGEVWRGRECGELGAHAKGYNEWVGVCYIGGVNSAHEPKDTRTELQRIALAELLAALRIVYGPVPIVGHHDLPGVRKACPSFDARNEYEELWTE